MNKAKELMNQFKLTKEEVNESKNKIDLKKMDHLYNKLKLELSKGKETTKLSDITFKFNKELGLLFGLMR